MQHEYAMTYGRVSEFDGSGWGDCSGFGSGLCEAKAEGSEGHNNEDDYLQESKELLPAIALANGYGDPQEDTLFCSDLQGWFSIRGARDAP